LFSPTSTIKLLHRSKLIKKAKRFRVARCAQNVIESPYPHHSVNRERIVKRQLSLQRQEKNLTMSSSKSSNNYLLLGSTTRNTRWSINTIRTLSTPKFNGMTNSRERASIGKTVTLSKKRSCVSVFADRSSHRPVSRRSSKLRILGRPVAIQSTK